MSSYFRAGDRELRDDSAVAPISPGSRIRMDSADGPRSSEASPDTPACAAREGGAQFLPACRPSAARLAYTPTAFALGAPHTTASSGTAVTVLSLASLDLCLIPNTPQAGWVQSASNRKD